VAAIFAVRMAATSGPVETLDGVHFVRGVLRYSVAEQRPHWPGYPVYIAAGKLLGAAGLPPAVALRVLSVAGWTACVFLIAAIVGTRAGGVAAAAAWGLAPAAWFTGQMVLSDVPALALALGTLWLATRAAAGEPARPVMGAWLAGLTIGVRLPYAALLLPWARAHLFRRRPLLALGVCLSLWLGGQLARDPAYLAQGAARVYAHLGNWNHRVLMQLGARGLAFGETFIVHGLGAWWPGVPLERVPATLGLFAAFAGGVFVLRRDRVLALALALWTLPYLLLVLTANDPRVARYALPLTASAAIVAGLGVARLGRYAWVGTAALVLAQGAVLVPLERQARRQPPLPVQVVAYVAAHIDPRRDIVLVTEDAASLRLFLEEAGLPVAAASQEGLLARAEELSRAGGVVYSTAPSVHAPERWVVEARFRRDRLLESRAPWDAWLFRYAPPAAVSATSRR